jgi:hypothetical protein
MLSALLLASCEKPVKVYVQCVWAIGGVSCSVEHREGSIRAHACWDVNLGCANHLNFTASACQDVEPAATSVRVIPIESFKAEGLCDRVVTSSVGNVNVQ